MYSQPVVSTEEFALVGRGGDSVLRDGGSGPCTATATDARSFTSQ